MRWFDDSVEDMVDDKQYRGISTTDALVGMMHRWCEATDKLTTTCVLLIRFQQSSRSHKPSYIIRKVTNEWYTGMHCTMDCSLLARQTSTG